MRVTSEFFVSALIRRVFSSGGFAAVERRGATEAGAVFLRRRRASVLTSIIAGFAAGYALVVVYILYRSFATGHFPWEPYLD